MVHTAAIHNELIMEIEISGIARETWMKNKMKREKYRRVLCRAVRKKKYLQFRVEIELEL